MRDDLGFELRGLSSMVMEEREPGARIPPGALALRLAGAFGLRGIDVDLALAVLGAELDHSFAALLDSVGARSPGGLLGVLVPTIEQRLTLVDAIGPHAPIIRKRLMRAVVRDQHTKFVSTRRFRAAVLGQELLEALPDFASRVEGQPPPFEWMHAHADKVLETWRAAWFFGLSSENVIAPPRSVSMRSSSCGIAAARRASGATAICPIAPECSTPSTSCTFAIEGAIAMTRRNRPICDAG